MTKMFCDRCKRETRRNYVSDRLKGIMGGHGIEVMVKYGGTWNKGHLCLECLKNIINQVLKDHE